MRCGRQVGSAAAAAAAAVGREKTALRHQPIPAQPPRLCQRHFALGFDPPPRQVLVQTGPHVAAQLGLTPGGGGRPSWTRPLRLNISGKNRRYIGSQSNDHRNGRRTTGVHARSSSVLLRKQCPGRARRHRRLIGVVPPEVPPARVSVRWMKTQQPILGSWPSLRPTAMHFPDQDAHAKARAL
jgi:hypothetical protein